MTPHQKESLGMEGEEWDSTFSINRVVVENEVGTIMRDNIIRGTNSNKTLSLVMDTVRQGKISENIKKTPYAKVFEELSVFDGLLLKVE